MPDKTYLVRIKPPCWAFQRVVAVSAEIHGDHLVFLTSEGTLAALFMTEIVESWDLLPASVSEM
jgi:hypothetical protein